MHQINVFPIVLLLSLASVTGCESLFDSKKREPAPFGMCMVQDAYQSFSFQQTPVWCWAACVEMLVNHGAGRRVIDQPTIVHNAHGSAVALPGDACAAFNRVGAFVYGPYGQRMKLQMTRLPFPAVESVAQYVCNNQLVILGTEHNQHVVVAYGISGHRLPGGQWESWNLLVFDPISGHQMISSSGFMTSHLWTDTYVVSMIQQ